MPTPKFGLAKTSAEARKIAEDIASNDLVGIINYVEGTACFVVHGMQIVPCGLG